MNSWHLKTIMTLVAVVSIFPFNLFAEEGISGTWVGAILSKSGTNDHNLILSFTGSTRKPSGETHYLDLGCKGKLKLRKNKRNTYRFIETITEGTDRCASGSTVEISVENNGNLAYKWLYPNGKIGLSASLVQDGNAIANIGSKPKSNSSQKTSESELEDEATDAENKALALRYLEDTAAHPEDPENPAGVSGISDEQLANMEFEEVQELFELTLEYAESETDQPRFLFALGRAAYLHGDEEYARELLEKAEFRGSAAASAYLAKTLDDSDLGGMADQLRKAVNGGFNPARSWLAEIESTIAERQEAKRREEEAKRLAAFDFNRFNRPDLIKGFYNSDLKNVSTTPFQTLAYVSAIQELLMDQSAVLFLTDDRMILSEPDPNLATIIGRKSTSNSQIYNEGMKASYQSSPLALLMGVVQDRKNGASIGQEVQNMGRRAANNPMTEVRMIKDQAAQDARVLVIYYESNPEAFRKVYSGIKKYVYGL